MKTARPWESPRSNVAPAVLLLGCLSRSKRGDTVMIYGVQSVTNGNAVDVSASDDKTDHSS
ncbi:MAG: hypothetical protein ACYS8L_11520 [Planctomycetota bacterium]|jgi:hypothetical protein